MVGGEKEKRFVLPQTVRVDGNELKKGRGGQEQVQFPRASGETHTITRTKGKVRLPDYKRGKCSFRQKEFAMSKKYGHVETRFSRGR